MRSFKKLLFVINKFVIGLEPILIGIVLLLLIFFSPTQAAVMTSENYRIQFDSLNAGGMRQTSENYIMEDTIGEIATGESSSETYKLKAGYQQMDQTYLSISDGANIVMSNMDITNSTSTGSTSWTVTTDDAAGYKLEVASSQKNPLRSANTSEQFADYAEAAGTTPEVWNTTDGAYEFGFSAYGDDTPTATWGNGGTCGTGTTINQSMKYRGFNNAADDGAETIQIATKSSRTETSGVTTNFCVGAVQSHVFTPSGTYTATTTATATSL